MLNKTNAKETQIANKQSRVRHMSPRLHIFISTPLILNTKGKAVNFLRTSPTIASFIDLSACIHSPYLYVLPLQSHFNTLLLFSYQTMGFSQSSIATLLLAPLVVLCSLNLCFGARKLTSLYEPPPMLVKYHNGALLEGKLPVSILWYGKFTPSQKSIVADFLLSLNPTAKMVSSSSPAQPSVSLWWKTIEIYMKKAGKKMTQIVLSSQVSIENYALGKNLKRTQISELTQKMNSELNSLVLVLTDKDVTVEGFCMNSCGFHGSNPKKNSAFLWVGNSVTQCPGQCAWPFHQPIYGPQTAPLVAPNGDVGMDGMIINIASLLAGTVTNPFGNGYYQGSSGAHLEASSMCPGVYGKGAYPGYAGQLLLDSGSGASYNAQGVNRRKFLLPALFDPSTSTCSTIV